MDSPPVSVILPVYDAAAYVRAALDSVAAQNYAPLEIIVVDDGSTDGSGEAAQAWAAERGLAVRCVVQANAGPAAARNRGLALARGEWIAFQDADDLWTPDKLRRQFQHSAAAPDAQVILGYTRAWVSGADGLPDGALQSPALRPVVQAGLFRRAVFDRVGLFAETLRQSEDLDWYIRALEAGVPIVVRPEVVLLYRRHAANLTNDAPQAARQFLRAVKRSLDRRRAGASLPRTSGFPPATGEQQ